MTGALVKMAGADGECFLQTAGFKRRETLCVFFT